MQFIFISITIMYILPLLFKRFRTKVFFTEMVLGVMFTAYLSWLSNNGEHLFTILIIMLSGVLIIPCISRLLFQSYKWRFVWLIPIVLLFFTSWLLLRSSPEDISNIIKSGKGSVTYIENNKEVLNIDGHRPQPLASVIKVIVAKEYAHQVVNHRINPNESVNYDEILKYHLNNTDGGAQAAFEEKYDTSHLTLNDVAKGMIRYSSNANTDYLIDRLQLDNVNKQIKSLNMKRHSQIYSLIGGMVMASDISEGDLSAKITDEQLVKDSIKYKDNYITGKIKEKDVLKKFDMKRQSYWSDHLTHGSTSDYAHLMNDINQDKFNEKETKILRSLMEQIKSQPIKQKYQHYGYKGGSTAKVINGVYYVTEKKNNKRKALAFFLDDLNMWEAYKAQKAMKLFRDKIFEDEDFRASLKNIE